MSSIYLIGSLRNPRIPEIAKELRNAGHEVFDDWHSVGPECDEKWQEYEKNRGRSYKEAIEGYHAKDVFDFDKRHLDRCDTGVLVLPAGKSAHLELGYIIGRGKTGYVLFDAEPERFDIMYQFADGIFFSVEELIQSFAPKQAYEIENWYTPEQIAEIAKVYNSPEEKMYKSVDCKMVDF